MSDAAIAAEDVAVRVRKERVHTTMLIELLSLLIFLAIAFAFVLKEEGERTNPWKERAVRLEGELKAEQALNSELRVQIRALKQQVDTLKQSVRRLLAAHEGPLAANDAMVPVAKAEFDKLTTNLANDQDLLKELQRENAQLRAQLGRINGKGADLPNCTITPGFLVSVDLLGDGTYKVSPKWSANAADAVRQVAGATSLASGAALTAAEFSAKAQVVKAWGRNLPTPCAFRAIVVEHHGDLELYKRQVRTVEQYFYVRRN